MCGGNGGNGGKVFNILFTSALQRKKTAKRVAERVAETSVCFNVKEKTITTP